MVRVVLYLYWYTGENFAIFQLSSHVRKDPSRTVPFSKQQKAKLWFGNEAIRPKSTVIAKHLCVGHMIMQVRQGRSVLVRSCSEQKT